MIYRSNNILIYCLLLIAGCGSSKYVPHETARSEITASYHRGIGLRFNASGHTVAQAWSYSGMAEFVKCVPLAHKNAISAHRKGSAAIALSVFGALLNTSSVALSIIAGFDSNNLARWVVPATFGFASSAGLGISVRFLKDHADGHAVDAMNYYNDAVGSLGASCDDLNFPEPTSN